MKTGPKEKRYIHIPLYIKLLLLLLKGCILCVPHSGGLVLYNIWRRELPIYSFSPPKFVPFGKVAYFLSYIAEVNIAILHF